MLIHLNLRRDLGTAAKAVRHSSSDITGPQQLPQNRRALDLCSSLPACSQEQQQMLLTEA